MLLLAKLLFFIKCMLIFQSMGVTEMASILTQQSLGNECNDNEPMLQPHPDQTDTIDGEFFFPVQLPLTELWTKFSFTTEYTYSNIFQLLVNLFTFLILLVVINLQCLSVVNFKSNMYYKSFFFIRKFEIKFVFQ